MSGLKGSFLLWPRFSLMIAVNLILLIALIVVIYRTHHDISVVQADAEPTATSTLTITKSNKTIATTQTASTSMHSNSITKYTAQYRYEEVIVSESKHLQSWMKEFRQTGENYSCQMQCDELFRNYKRCTGYLTVDEYMCQFFLLNGDVFTDNTSSQGSLVKVMARTELKKGNLFLLAGGSPYVDRISNVTILDLEEECYTSIAYLPIPVRDPIVTVVGNQVYACAGELDQAFTCWFYDMIGNNWVFSQMTTHRHERIPGITWSNRIYMADMVGAEFYDATLDIMVDWLSAPMDGSNLASNCITMWNTNLITTGTKTYMFRFKTQTWKIFPQTLEKFQPYSMTFWSPECIVIPNTDLYLLLGLPGSLLLNLTSGNWTEIQNGPLRSGGVLTTYGNRVFLVGGILANRYFSSDIFELDFSDLTDLKWSLYPSATSWGGQRHFRMVPLPRFLFDCNAAG